MFTRSARRGHNSLSEESVVDNGTDTAIKKPRHRRMKDNICEDHTLHHEERRKNYVSYPTDDEGLLKENIDENMMHKDKKIKKKKNKTKVLKEINQNEEESGDNVQTKAVRLTRQKKKINCDEEQKFVSVVESNKRSQKPIDTNPVTTKDVEKNFKKSKRNKNGLSSQILEVDQVTEMKKNNKKKKKGERSNSSLGPKNDIEEKRNKSKLNKSISSIDSFHSAAGSPVSKDINKNNAMIDDQKTVKRRKSSIKIDTPKSENVTNHANYTRSTEPDNPSTTVKQTRSRKSSTKEDIVNDVKILKESNNSLVQSTIIEEKVKSRNTSVTNEIQSHINGITSDSNHSANKTLSNQKKSLTKSNDSTQNIEDIKQDNTSEKMDEKTSTRSSLISSDATLNITYDRSDISRISITSDDSKSEHIVNTTPLLIESSIDESHVKNTPKKAEVTKEHPATTPLKREGTFTKEAPEVMSPRVTRNSQTPIKQSLLTPKKSLERTPTSRVSVGTPGSTPFPFSKSSQKEKVLLNVTRSIEKQSSQRSSIVKTASRPTRVMFCSPLDNPVPTNEAKRKIVKSNLKGSNKSFVFDDTVSAVRTTPAPLGRKRTNTQDGATSAKRSRIADDATARMSRARTFSASAKLSTTPSKKPVTPSQARTKLPNFAALHQRRFEKMESLDECQERKAKRARQLLAASGAPGLQSLAGMESPMKSTRESARKSELKAKVETKTKLKPPAKREGKSIPEASITLPSLSILSKGYTRFGFKMNVGVNPFSVPSEPQQDKPVTSARKPNAQAVRKDAAKQIIMGQKPSSNKNETKRIENRMHIKGVRTNRRFELQMMMRVIDG